VCRLDSGEGRRGVNSFLLFFVVCGFVARNNKPEKLFHI